MKNHIKMWSYQYRDSQYEDKTVMRPSDLCNGNPFISKDNLIIETDPRWTYKTYKFHGLVQDWGNSTINALEVPRSGANPSNSTYYIYPLLPVPLTSPWFAAIHPSLHGIICTVLLLVLTYDCSEFKSFMLKLVQVVWFTLTKNCLIKKHEKYE